MTEELKERYRLMPLTAWFVSAHEGKSLGDSTDYKCAECRCQPGCMCCHASTGCACRWEDAQPDPDYGF